MIEYPFNVFKQKQARFLNFRNSAYVEEESSSRILESSPSSSNRKRLTGKSRGKKVVIGNSFCWYIPDIPFFKFFPSIVFPIDLACISVDFVCPDTIKLFCSHEWLDIAGVTSTSLSYPLLYPLGNFIIRFFEPISESSYPCKWFYKFNFFHSLPLPWSLWCSYSGLLFSHFCYLLKYSYLSWLVILG